MKALQLDGKRFGRFLVVKRVESEKGRSLWLCRCDCGKEKIVIGYKLTSGHTISCGCAGREHSRDAKIKHGDALSTKRERLYNIWAAMKRRCYNPKCDAFPYYGGKGITVCKTWHDYKKFKKWALENGYAENLTIDRLDANKDYTPSNCRWITKDANISRAKSKPNKLRERAFLLYKQGMKQKDVCKELGINQATFRRWREQKKLPIRSPYSENFKQLVFCLRREGMRTKDILEMSGIGESTFHQWLIDAGIS